MAVLDPGSLLLSRRYIAMARFPSTDMNMLLAM